MRGYYAPEYGGGSVVNLLASLWRARGGRSPHPDLAGFPRETVRRARRVVYLLLDGLGEHQLRAYLARVRRSPFFAAHPRQVITTVFPATTAAAVTTFATGASPLEHAVLGWTLHLPDLGMVSTILLGSTLPGTPMAGPDFDLGRYLRLPSHLESVPPPRDLISYGEIPDSRYSRAGLRWHHRAACLTPAGLARQILTFARRRGQGLAYAYWPMLDTLAHREGCFARKPMAHLAQLDRMLAHLTVRLRGMGVVLLVTADHGLVDTPPETTIELRDIPGFYEDLAMIPSGDARQVSCFVRPGRVKDFRRVVRNYLARACVCLPGEDLIEGGYFGRGRIHPAFRARLGDFVLIARKGYAFSSGLFDAPSKKKKGNHGGMSAEEMRVPLFIVAP